MLRINEVKIPACSPDGTLKKRISSIIDIPSDEIKEIIILKRSIDARRGRGVNLVYNLIVTLESEKLERRVAGKVGLADVVGRVLPWKLPDLSPGVPGTDVPVVGSGPAGLFAAYTLASYGFRVLLLERGRKVEERVRDISRFWRKGELDSESNAQFGEGGAGTFSDGKLTTRIKGPEAEFVLSIFSDLGGGEELLIDGKPHMGTNRLLKVVRSFRERLTDMGVAFRFESKVSDLTVSGGRISGLVIDKGERIDCVDVILAPGHSARDTFNMLAERNVTLNSKPFAVGIRVEHPQKLIDDLQYGKHSNCGCLPPADYRMAVRTSGGRPVYTFCMCPGGMVMLASSDEARLPVNGMSPSRRRSGFANSGVVAAVSKDDFGDGPFAGLRFQEKLEEGVFGIAGGNYVLPSSSLDCFLSGRGRVAPGPGRWAGAGRVPVDLRRAFPPDLLSDLAEGISMMDKKMKGFITGDANAYAVESRTSSPIRIVRGEDYQSISHPGLYPAGEGSGYSGGIMSSAVDGIRAALAIVRKHT